MNVDLTKLYGGAVETDVASADADAANAPADAADAAAEPAADAEVKAGPDPVEGDKPNLDSNDCVINNSVILQLFY